MTKILEDLRASQDAITDREEQLALFEIDEQIAKKGSVVKSAYKIKYKLRAKAAGLRGKAAKRSTWDWLAQVMASQTLTKKAKTDVEALTAFLDANGVEFAHWLTDENGRDKRKPGWEGRLRMSGGMALRRIVAERGTVFLNDGSELEVPEADLEALVAKYDI